MIRTLDIGGDKHCDCLSLEEEDNPFLGFRAIRICLQQKRHVQSAASQYLKSRTLWKTGDHDPNGYHVIGNLRDEAVDRRSQRRDAKKKNIPFAEDVPVGIMVETPASAVMAPLFAKHVDFFQYRYE